jgi:N-methylhydantoinase B
VTGLSRGRLDPVTFGVLSAALVSIAEEMGAALRASSYSPIIREMQDYSCALFDPDGRLVAQGEFIPAQLGAIALVVRSAIEAHAGSVAPGDVFIANHPYRGGAHTPDVNVIRPVFGSTGRSARLVGWVGTVAHQVDFGGANPGTEGADHRDLFAEGLVLPPVRLENAAGPAIDLYELIAANVRDPVATLADLRGQVAACRVGERRLLELVSRYGRPTIEAAFRDAIDHAERRTRAALAALPEGEAAAEACVDDDGAGGPPTRIAVRLEKRGDRLTVDLSGSAGQVPGGLNVPWASTLAAVAYLVRVVSDPTIPANEGTLAPVTIVCPEGSVLRPRPPAAVSVRHLTIQRLADVMLRAATSLWPERVPVAGHFVGFFSLMAVGPSARDGRPTVFQDVVGGGTGAHANGPGLDAVDTHLSNVGLLSAEVCETEYPWRLVRSELLPRSGGAGRWAGGRGVRRTYEVLAAPQPVVLYCEQTDPRWRPWGAAGGADGTVTRLVVRDRGGRRLRVPTKGTITLEPGSTVTVETGGGGGYGPPSDRTLGS